VPDIPWQVIAFIAFAYPRCAGLVGGRQLVGGRRAPGGRPQGVDAAPQRQMRSPATRTFRVYLTVGVGDHGPWAPWVDP
jgi:hypothetical protein